MPALLASRHGGMIAKQSKFKCQIKFKVQNFKKFELKALI